jgi:UDP-N-acetylglucosamine 2-epimerase (non-hydrolysing)
MFTGMNPERILQSIEVLSNQLRGDLRNINLVKDYVAPNVSEKVVRVILSYVDYVNSNVWRK